MSSSDRTVLLAGATGLVGGYCLTHLLASSSVERVVVVTRRVGQNPDPRVSFLVNERFELEQAAPIPARVALCALGTTIQRAGSQAAFREVDHDAVLSFARWAQRGGAQVLGLVSSVGADASSRNFYLGVKGETEASVSSLGFFCFVALRPSLLLGRRRERRLGEAWARAVMPWLNPLLVGPARRYRAIPADVVGRACVSLVVQPVEPGRHMWHYDEIRARAALLSSDE